MIRRLPIVPTIIVVAAAAAMVGLGVWQLRRAEWKEGLLVRYAAAGRLPPIAWPTISSLPPTLPLFRHATGLCQRPAGQRSAAGTNRAGESGYLFIVDCATDVEGPSLSVELGWSKNPRAQYSWNGGPVKGVIAPDKQSGMRLVSASAPRGLEPSAIPTPDSIPNNHRFYAFQWFFFAAAALVIYVLALRKRWAETS